MLRLFRTNNEAGGFLLLLLYALLLRSSIWLGWGLEPMPVRAGALHKWISGAISSPMLSAVLATALVVIQGFWLSVSVNRLRLSKQSHYLVGAFYVLLMSLSPQFLYLEAPLVANAFLIFAFSEVVGLYQLQKAGARIYNVGFWLGLAALFSWGYVGFCVWALLAISILRAIHIRELLVLAAGWISPWWLVLVLFYWQDRISYFWSQSISEQSGWTFLRTPSFSDWQSLLLLSMFVVLLLIVIFMANRFFVRQNIQAKKQIQLIFWGLLLSTLPLLILYPISLQYMIPAFPFLAVLLGLLADKISGGVAESIHWLTVFALFFLHFGI